jgi:ABC superfamily ATP binding cassette transporter, membrane protein
MSLLLRTNYAIARSSLKRQKLRTFLTSLGIAIGIASIVYTFGIIGSFKNLVKAETNDALLVLQQKPEESTDISSILTAKPLISSPFNKETIELVQKSINTTAAISPLAPITYNLSGDNLVANGNILGLNESALKILGLKVKTGSFQSDASLKTIVLGHNLSLQLFGTAESIGKTVNVKGERYIVTGVLENQDNPRNFTRFNFNQIGLVNYDQLTTLNPIIEKILIQLPDHNTMLSVKDSLNKKLSENPNLTGAFQLASEEQISHPASSNIKLITVLLSIIAIISIIVGSISITSIMIATVTERTHEIGVRKAIGATHFNIFLQFIFESILLNLSGAVLGFIIGYAALLATAFLTEFKIYFSPEIPAIALGVALFTGFISGTIPSLKAAGKNPIDSIKQPNR